MTEGFAKAFGPAVRVNTLMSGTMMTDISLAWDVSTMTAGMQNTTSLKRIGEPHEIVGAAIYLASDASTYTSCATIRVDGGMY